MRVRNMALAGLAGAAVAYFFDPMSGSARRSRLRATITALIAGRARGQAETAPLPENMAPVPETPVPGVRRVQSLHLPESETISRPITSRPLGDTWNG